MKALKELFSEPDGKLSSKRVLSGALVLTFISSYLYTVITNRTIIDVPNNWMVLLLGLLGLLSATTIYNNKNNKQ